MFKSDERSVRIKTDGRVAVDGIVRVKRLAFELGSASVGVEHHDPIAVVVERDGHRNRVPISDGKQAPSWLAWVAVPVVAGLAARMARGHKRKDP